jgi:two-component system, chemotaxis family, sensor kinase CheA
MIDKFRQSFREEARELLTELESALLELDRKRDDREVVGRAFRALHTIKGSGAMFGFDDIAGFAHNLETAFDRLRNGQLSATADLINLTLAAGDHIKSMLEAEDGGAPADMATSTRILSELQRLTEIARPESDAVAETQVVVPVEVQSAAAENPGAVVAWRIRFRPSAEILLHGMNPRLLLRELRGLGKLEIVLDTSAIPPLAELQAEHCYLAWDLVLTTAVPIETIRDVFIFVEDDCELAIEPLARDSRPTAPRAGIAVQPNQSASKAREAPAVNPPATAASLRVSTSKLDELVNLVGELVTVQARLGEIAGRHDDADLRDVSEAVDRVTAALRDNSMSIRMLPMRATFERFRRLVHDLGVDLQKEVAFTVEGAETELDKTVIDQLNDPLVHLIRNSMDHGIESAEDRRAAGKNPSGTIHLSARHSGANVLIQVSDDGKGMDHEAVRARAVERGLIDAGVRLSEPETLALIMSPGFSTARQVSDVSGRGVGMDVVRRNIESLRGSVEVSSRPGQGLTVTLRLPLTLAIIDGLLVRVGDAHFILPLAQSRECVELTRRDIEAAHGRHLANLRGEIIPYIRLSEFFQIETTRPEREQIMVVETDSGQYGLVVDQVLGDHQTVIKNLGRLYRNVQVVSGATILGNGTVALILDPNRLVQCALQGGTQKLRASDWSPPGNRPEPVQTLTKEDQIDGRQANR